MGYLRGAFMGLVLSISGASWAETSDLELIQGLAAQGDWDAALVALEERIGADPNDVQARFLKGLLLMQRGNSDQARMVFAEIVRQFPRLPEAFNNLAVIYADQGEYEKARQALLSAVANAPEYGMVRANLGDLYAKMAFDAYRKAIELDPEDEATRAKLRLIENMFHPEG